MVKVKIIAGIYGYRPKPGGPITPKSTKDPPFEIADEKAARLVALGVAKYINKAASEKNTGSDDSGAKSSGNAAGKGLPEYNDGMKLNELKDIAKVYGVDKKTLSKLRSKASVIDAINEKRRAGTSHAGGDSEDSAGSEGGDQDDDDDDDDETDESGDGPPQLNAQEPQL